MSDIADGLGTAAEGTLLARAVEPTAQERGESGPDLCKNCGAELSGPHCHQCGQKRDIHRSFAAIGHEILHGVLHLDGKIWRTLPLLAKRPGELTRRYINGERVKFVSPMAMFLFSVFLMFAVFQVFGATTPTNIETDPRQAVSELAAAEAERVSNRLNEIEAQLADQTLSDDERGVLEAQRASLSQELMVLTGEAPVTDLLDAPDDAPAAAENDEVSSDAEKAFDLAGDRVDGVIKSNIPIVSKTLEKWQANPDLMIYKFQTNAYKFSWLLIPLSIPFMWFLFVWKRRFKAYDHAIFVTYSLSFMSLLFVLLSLLGRIGFPSALATIAAIIIPPLHIYKQLRGTYDLSRFSALWRLAVLMVCILIVVLIFAQVLLLLGTG